MKGVDVSSWQNNIDWYTVKSNIDFAILRAGYGDDLKSQDDFYFVVNAEECSRRSIPFGVYIYSYATTISQAKSEAAHVLRLIKDYKLSYPVYLDLEDENTTGKLTNSEIADIAITFCDIIEKNGYIPGIYANTYWFNNKLTDPRLDRFEKWVAQYNSECTYEGEYQMWQYSSSESVPGIVGNVDMNICYKDYPKFIRGDIMEKLVVYQGDIDALSAIMISQKYGCPMMKKSDYLNSQLNVIQLIEIGGKEGNRYDTFKEAANLL